MPPMSRIGPDYYKNDNLLSIKKTIKQKTWKDTKIAVLKKTTKEIFDGRKPSSELTLKTKWYQSCGCCNDSQSCEQLKKSVTDKYFEKKKKKKIDFEP